MYKRQVYGILHALYIGYRQAELVKEIMQFLIVQSHVDQSGTFFFYQDVYKRQIYSWVSPSASTLRTG